MLALRDLIDELLAVQHVARFDRLDWHVRPGLGRCQRVGDQRKCLAQGVNKLIDFCEA